MRRWRTAKNLYHGMIDLKDNAKALAFAHALDQWMTRLQADGVIGGWRLAAGG